LSDQLCEEAVGGFETRGPRRERGGGCDDGDGGGGDNRGGLRIPGLDAVGVEEALDAGLEITAIEEARGEGRRRGAAEAGHAHEGGGERERALVIALNRVVIGGPFGEAMPVPLQRAEAVASGEEAGSEPDEEALEVV